MRSFTTALVLLLSTSSVGTFSAAAASAADLAFVGPAGWSPTASATAPDPAHPFSQWHLPGDSTASLTYARTTTAYADSLALIHANFTANKIKPAVDKDTICQGKTAHVIEFSAGPQDHKVVINRMIVPTPDGIAAVTYSRADGTTFDPDVAKAETAYCASPS